MSITHLRTDVLVVGGGTGGVAAALAAARSGVDVILTTDVAWLGGQFTSQAVPPDEHPWVETMGVTATYRSLRDGVREHYRRHRPLTDAARRHPALNPGAGWVSKLCHEPAVAAAVIEAMLAPHEHAGRLHVLRDVRPVAADVMGDVVRSVTFADVRDGEGTHVEATYVVDATELGDLLPLTGTEHVTGFESRDDTGEPSAPDVAQPDNMQAFSVCFAVEHVDGDHTIDRPGQYDRWRAVWPDFWGGPLLGWRAPHPRTLEVTERSFSPNPGDDALAVEADQSRSGGDDNLWTFRRILARDMFLPGSYASDLTLVNWPSIDYFEGPVVGVDEATAAARVHDARQLSLSMLFWMQTDAPRPDGGTGWPGLRLRPDVMGTADGLAQEPYHRESRRIVPQTRVVEQDLSQAVRGSRGARRYRDSVGVGMYRIDLHPSTGGDNYIDVGAEPFELPMGAVLPQRVRNLLAGGKNIGTTHITNGCYRLHPVEWNAGEVAGLLAAHCLESGREPGEVHAKDELLEEFQRICDREGIPRRWPDHVRGY